MPDRDRRGIDAARAARLRRSRAEWRAYRRLGPNARARLERALRDASRVGPDAPADRGATVSRTARSGQQTRPLTTEHLTALAPDSSLYWEEPPPAVVTVDGTYDPDDCADSFAELGQRRTSGTVHRSSPHPRSGNTLRRARRAMANKRSPAIGDLRTIDLRFNHHDEAGAGITPIHALTPIDRSALEGRGGRFCYCSTAKVLPSASLNQATLPSASVWIPLSSAASWGAS